MSRFTSMVIAIVLFLTSHVAAGEVQLRILHTAGTSDFSTSLDLKGPRQIHIVPQSRKIIIFGYVKDPGSGPSWVRVREGAMTLPKGSRIVIEADEVAYQIVEPGANPREGQEIADSRITFDIDTEALTIEGRGAEGQASKESRLSGRYVVLDIPHPRDVSVTKGKEEWLFRISGVYPGSQVAEDFLQVARESGLNPLQFAQAKEPGGGTETVFDGMAVPIKHAETIAAGLEKKGYRIKLLK